jgi:hypothetical protein
MRCGYSGGSGFIGKARSALERPFEGRSKNTKGAVSRALLVPVKAGVR